MSDLAYDITDKDVAWMQEQYRNKFGVTVDTEAAYRKLHLLVRQMELLYRPITKKQVQEINDNENNISSAHK